MNKVILLVMLVVFSGCANQSSKIGGQTDEKIYSSFIGKWVIDPRDKGAYPSVTQYKEDGSLFFRAFRSPDCRYVLFEVSAKWKIENSELVITVMDTSNELFLTKGTVIRDSVVKVEDGKMILRGSDGDLQYRLRRDRCVSGIEV